MAKVSLTFDARYLSSKTGEAPVKIRLSHKSKGAFIPLEIKLKEGQWDGKKVIKHTKHKSLNEELQKILFRYKEALKSLEQRIDVDTIDIKRLREMLVDEANPDRIKFDKNTVEAVFRDFISHKSKRTGELYTDTWNKIKAFEGSHACCLRFEEITNDWLHRFNDFMAPSAVSANTRAIHFRNLRAIFNYAIDNEITTHYPFRKFKIKGQATRKRNFDVKVLRAMFEMTGLSKSEEKYRDLFKLMFMLMGINFVDLCNLEKVENGRIYYIRAKTKKLYSVKVEPEAMELIEKYKGEKHLLNYLDHCVNPRHFYNNTCKGLSAIKDRLNELKFGIDTLSTYWARHSWATIAASLDIPKETIAAGLGHSSRTVTDIYIDFDKRKVDKANRMVLDWVLHRKLPAHLDPEDFDEC